MEADYAEEAERWDEEKKQLQRAVKRPDWNAIKASLMVRCPVQFQTPYMQSRRT